MSLRRSAPALSLALLALAVGSARGDDEQEAPEIRYRARTDAALTHMTVEACFPGEPPRSIGPGIDRAASALEDARASNGDALPTRRGRIDTSSLSAGDCVTYRVDLEEARRVSRFSQRHGVDFVSSQGAWLWRPRRRAPRLATIRFDLPDGIRVGAPWPREGDGYRLDRSAFRRPAFVAFGRFEPLRVSARGVDVELVRLGDGWRMSLEETEEWLRLAIDGVSTVQGRFPVSELLVVFAPGAGDGVGFGMVRRGGGCSVGFIVGQRSDAADLRESWVTWHELSHLQLPAMVQSDAWLYEGLATYYQEVLPARVGVQTEREAWRALRDGFRRGARFRERDPLETEAENMHRTRAYQRVYWAGTAFALEADVALRERGSSLDEALRRGARQWRGDPDVWRSGRLTALLDRPLDSPLLGPLRDVFAERVAFPDTASLLERLGVGPGGRLSAAPLSSVRAAIMSR